MEMEDRKIARLDGPVKVNGFSKVNGLSSIPNINFTCKMDGFSEADGYLKLKNRAKLDLLKSIWIHILKMDGLPKVDASVKPTSPLKLYVSDLDSQNGRYLESEPTCETQKITAKLNDSNLDFQNGRSCKSERPLY